MTRPDACDRKDGFTLIELLVSTAITMTVTAGVFTVMNPSGGIFQTQPEMADVQQRLRVGVDTLKHDLLMAGGGAYSGPQSGTLNGFFASVQPRRIGFLAAYDDPPDTFRSDAITLFYVPSTPAQTTISAPMPATSAELKVDHPPNCPPKDLCGFEEGMQVLLYDETGSFDTLTITDVQDAAGHVQRNRQGPLSKSYAAGAKIVEVQQHVYWLDTTTDQLMHYDGYQTAVAVVDNVVALDFEYYGEPDPPALRRPGIDRSTTYGPTPPALGVAQAPWPAGENCTITVVAGQQRSRLPCWARRAAASSDDGGELDRWSLVSGCGQPQPVRCGSLQGAEDSSQSPRAERQSGTFAARSEPAATLCFSARHIAGRLQSGARSGDSLRRQPPEPQSGQVRTVTTLKNQPVVQVGIAASAAKAASRSSSR